MPFLLSRLRTFALSCVLSGAFWVLALPARADLATIAYQESADSFVWELAWDGGAPERNAELQPDAPESWTPKIRTFRNPAGPRTVRFVFEARHASRVHEMDAPDGTPFRAELYLNSPLRGPSDWTRLEGRQLPHLATPKDHQDAFDVFYRVETDPGGAKTGRLLFQAAHGPAGKAKKAKKAPVKRSGENLKKPR